MISARIREDSFGDGIDIAIIMKPGEYSDGVRRILHIVGIDPDGRLTQRWDEMVPGAAREPTLTLTDDEARALLAALHTHYSGVEDTRTLRRDYDHERGRVDKLADVISTLALQLAGPVD